MIWNNISFFLAIMALTIMALIYFLIGDAQLGLLALIASGIFLILDEMQS